MSGRPSVLEWSGALFAFLLFAVAVASLALDEGTLLAAFVTWGGAVPVLTGLCVAAAASGWRGRWVQAAARGATAALVAVAWLTLSCSVSAVFPWYELLGLRGRLAPVALRDACDDVRPDETIAEVGGRMRWTLAEYHDRDMPREGKWWRQVGLGAEICYVIFDTDGGAIDSRFYVGD